MAMAMAMEDSTTWAIVTDNRTTTFPTILSILLEIRTMDHMFQAPTPQPMATTVTTLAAMATIFNSPRPQGDRVEDAEAASRRLTTLLPGGLVTSDR